MKTVMRAVITASILTSVMGGSARGVDAQHVTPAMAAAMRPPGPAAAGCEERAQQAARTLDVLNSSLERARRTGNESDTRDAMDKLQKGFADVQARLVPCRESANAQADPSAAQLPAPPAASATGMDHSRMNMGGAQPLAVEPGGAAAAPTTVRQISGPAEAALQSFQDALQVGNREVALRWLAPEATITEVGVTDGSRDAYANEHMAVDMTFLKTAKLVLIDRQVHPAGDSTHIASTSRVTGRAGEIPVDVTVTEEALLKKTLEGWRIVSLEWSTEPVRQEASDGGRTPAMATRLPITP